MSMTVAEIALIVLLSIALVQARNRNVPCKFGDKIEYGKLGEEIKIGGDIDAYIARPNGTESKGGVIVIQDIYGWELSNTRAIVDMLSDNNFTAILPDSFKGKSAWNRSMSWAQAPAWFAQRLPNGISDVLDACVEHLKSNESIDKVVMVGFCWGGRAVHYAMAERDDLQAGVSCYGLMDDEDPEFGVLNKPTLFIYGEADRQFPPQTIRTLRQALQKKSGTTKYSIRGYKNQGHGFLHRKLTSPDDPHKDEIYAARKKMIKWLNRYTRK